MTHDEAEDWFSLSADNGDAYTVLRQFHVAAGEGPDALLPSLKSRGLIRDSADCQFAPATDQPVPAGWTAWEVMPVGKLKQDFDARPQDEVPDPPCGEIGMTADSIGFFMVRKDHPDRVLHVNLGQDGTMIDPASITLN